MTTPFMPSPIPTPTTRAANRQCRDRRRRLLCAAGLGARPRSADPRQFGLFPRSRRADAARAHLQRSLLAGAGPAARRARGAHGDRPRRPQALAQLSSRADALGGEAELCAGAGRDRRPARRHHRAPARADPEAALRGLCDGQAGRDERDPLDLDLPERKILLKPDGTSIASSCRSGSTRTG